MKKEKVDYVKSYKKEFIDHGMKIVSFDELRKGSL